MIWIVSIFGVLICSNMIAEKILLLSLERERERQTDRQTDRQTNRDRKSQTDRHRETESLYMFLYIANQNHSRVLKLCLFRTKYPRIIQTNNDFSELCNFFFNLSHKLLCRHTSITKLVSKDTDIWQHNITRSMVFQEKKN